MKFVLSIFALASFFLFFGIGSKICNGFIEWIIAAGVYLIVIGYMSLVYHCESEV